MYIVIDDVLIIFYCIMLDEYTTIILILHNIANLLKLTILNKRI